MLPADIATILTEAFPGAVQQSSPEAWQVDTPEFRLLALLSEDKSWLRLLLPIAPAKDAASFQEQLLEANFDVTQTVRYAFSQGVLWGVFHHAVASLTDDDFREAIARLLALKKQGLDPMFDSYVEQSMRQIVRASKLQGQTLQATMQTIDRFYAEGMLGSNDQTPEQRERTLAAWRDRLERLWDEEEGN
ncbi:MAG: hypothetical protein AAFY11_00520 [Cyanobacteria bacterium J06641_5]